MEFQIDHAPVFPILRVRFAPGEQLKAEAGAMVASIGDLTLEAKASGKGIFGTLMAAVAGESVFGTLYTANSEAELILSPPGPGDILRLDLTGQTIYAQGGAYLAGSKELTISAKGSLKSFVAGEGLFLARISGNGPLFLSSFGAIVELQVQPGRTLRLDNGHLVAFEETVDYTLKRATSGIFSFFASGEGLVCEFTGSGRVWVQTRNLAPFANLLSRHLPAPSRSGE